MDKNKRKPQFQIRKVPIRRLAPEKTPQLNALDVHSICLPSRSRKNVQWGTLSQNHYQQQINPQIIYSPVYQQLYSQYLSLREHHSQQRITQQKEIDEIEDKISQEEEKKKRLNTMRDGLYVQVEQLREGLNDVRDKNYNLRWEIYHQRGAHYMNVNGFSLFQGGQMSYEELLQMEQQMGSVPKGLTEQEIAGLPVVVFGDFKNKEQPQPQQSQQICCICFDELQQSEELLKISCKHLHHKQCLRDWLIKQRVCPICKQEVIINE